MANRGRRVLHVVGVFGVVVASSVTGVLRLGGHEQPRGREALQSAPPLRVASAPNATPLANAAVPVAVTTSVRRAPPRAPAAANAAPVAQRQAGWQAQVSKGISASEYALRREGTRFRASNRAQNFVSYLDEGGAEVHPRAGDGTPIHLGAVSVGREGARQTALSRATPELGACRADGAKDVDGECLRRLETERGGISEIWENRSEGLEQAFVVARPPGGSGSLALSLDVSGADVSVAPDGAEARLTQGAGGLSLRYSGLLARDADGVELPAHLSAAAHGLVLVVDDAGARYPVTIDPLLTAVAWTADGGQANASFGLVVAGAGDVNGDGFDDVIVGAPLYDAAQTNQGRAFLFLGGPSGLSTTPAWQTSDGFVSGGRFLLGAAQYGFAVAGAGDVNDDGFDDVIVGSPGAGGRSEGAAFLYFGSASGLQQTAAWSQAGAGSGTRFGYSVATTDVNCDGIGDVIVGAPGTNAGSGIHGAVWMFTGRASQPPTPFYTLQLDLVDAWFGARVAAAGDIDANGCGDVLIGAPYHSDPGFPQSGLVWLFLGQPFVSQLVPPVIYEVDAGEANQKLGMVLAGVGDTNHDGHAEIEIGVPAANGGMGEVHHFDNFLNTIGPSAILSGTQAGEAFGSSIASAGDVNGDGFADVVIGAPNFDDGQTDEGAAFIYMGAHGFYAGVQRWTVESDQAGALFGSSVASAGDVNGDGLSDIVVGAPQFSAATGGGRAFAYLGSASVLSSTADSFIAAAAPLNEGNRFGENVASAGDVDGDGLSDILVGSPEFNGSFGLAPGRVLLFTQGSATAAWTQVGNAFDSNLGTAMAGAGDVDGDGLADIIIGNASGCDCANVFAGKKGSPPSTSASWTLNDPASTHTSKFGTSVASAGDVNDDGFSDIIVGGPQFPAGGGAFVFLGSSSGLTTTPAWTAHGSGLSSHFGQNVASAGDVNGDGYSDVLVGAPGSGTVASQTFLFLGTSSGVAASPAWSVTNPGPSGHLSIASAGDVNGDGCDDFLVGDATMSSSGTVQLYLGRKNNVPLTTPAWTRTGSGTDAFGFAVASAGDVNGDGFADVVIGAPGVSNGATSEGAAVVFLGSSTGLGSSPAWTTEGDNRTHAIFGSGVASAGDINGDGYSDVLVGAPGYGADAFGPQLGRAFAFLGNGSDVVAGAFQAVAAFGLAPQAYRYSDPTSLLAPGDGSVMDSFDVQAHAGTPFSRTSMRVDLEVKPLGTAFDGQNLKSGSFGDTFIFSRPSTSSGSLPAGDYHYRVRLHYDSDKAIGTTHTHWYYGGQPGSPLGVHVRVPNLNAVWHPH